MTLGCNMISKILEGSIAAVDNGNYTPSVNPAIENAVSVWEGSEQMLAESITVDINSEILLAYETFELAMTVGAANVVVEGSGSDGAMVVMENAFIDFFKKIGQKLKEIGEWIVSIFRRIFKRTKENTEKKNASTAIAYLEDKKAGSDGKTASEKIKEIKETAKSSSDPEKKQAAQNILDKLIQVNYSAGEQIAQNVDRTAKTSISAYERFPEALARATDPDTRTALSDFSIFENPADYYKAFSLTHFGRELDTLERVKNNMKIAWGVADIQKKRAAEVTNPRDMAGFVAWYQGEFRSGSRYQKTIDDIDNSCQKTAKTLGKMASSLDKSAANYQKEANNISDRGGTNAGHNATNKNAQSFAAQNKAKMARTLVTAYNALSSYVTAVLSEHISIATATFNLYTELAKKMGGALSAEEKSIVRHARKTAAREGLDFDAFLECENLGFDVTEESFDDDDLEGCGEGMSYSGSGITSAFSDYIRNMV